MAQHHNDAREHLAAADVTALSAAHGDPAVATGAGFSLSPQEAQAVLSQAITALEQLLQQQRQTQTLKKVSPPALDPASVAYNARLVSGAGVFTAASDHVSAEATYLNELIAKIRHAFGIVGDADSAAAGDVGRAATPQGSVAG